MNDDYRQKIIEMLAKKLGIEVEEITPESYFEDDLNLGELELLELITDIEDDYSIDLSEEKETLETVLDLLNAVTDKLE